MSKTELRKLTLAQLRQRANDAGLPCCRDFTKADYVDALAARAAQVVVDLAMREASPTIEQIRCVHQWDKPFREGETRTCEKCGGKQTN